MSRVIQNCALGLCICCLVLGHSLAKKLLKDVHKSEIWHVQAPPRKLWLRLALPRRLCLIYRCDILFSFLKPHEVLHSSPLFEAKRPPRLCLIILAALIHHCGHSSSVLRYSDHKLPHQPTISQPCPSNHRQTRAQQTLRFYFLDR